MRDDRQTLVWSSCTTSGQETNLVCFFRLVFEKTYNVLMGTLNPTHSLTHFFDQGILHEEMSLNSDYYASLSHLNKDYILTYLRLSGCQMYSKCKTQGLSRPSGYPGLWPTRQIRHGIQTFLPFPPLRYSPHSMSYGRRLRRCSSGTCNLTCRLRAGRPWSTRGPWADSRS